MNLLRLKTQFLKVKQNSQSGAGKIKRNPHTVPITVKAHTMVKQSRPRVSCGRGVRSQAELRSATTRAEKKDGLPSSGKKGKP